MKVVLVNPPMLRAEVTKVVGIKTPPMGLTYLAAALERGGYEARIIDANALNLSYSELGKLLEKENPDVVGVTAVTPMINEAVATIRLAKKSCPNAVTILGGPHATFCPEETFENCPELDLICLGEGEETLLDIAHSVEKGGNLRDVKGIAYRKSNHFSKTSLRPLINDLDSLPFPARHLLPMNCYTILGKNYPIVNIVFSRGCPFSCSFCSSSRIFGRCYRARTAKNVVDEIELVVHKYKVKSFEFSDDTFNLNRKRVEEICGELIGRKLDVSWACSSRADLVTKELLTKMKKAGCHLIFYGIESGSERVLSLMKKGETHAQMIRAIELSKNIGIETYGSFILGYPGETRNELLQTIAFARRIGVYFAQFSIATPYPGSELFEIAVKRNLLLTRDWSLYTAANPVMKPQNYTVEELRQFFVKAYRSFYSSPRVLIHHMRRGRIGTFTKIVKSLLLELWTRFLRREAFRESQSWW